MPASHANARKGHGNKASQNQLKHIKVEPASPTGKAKTGFLWFFNHHHLLFAGGCYAVLYWGWMLGKTNNSNKQVLCATRVC